MELKVKIFFSYYFPPVLWAVLIFYLSSLPVLTATEIYWQDFLLKKTAHFIEYMIFSLLLYRALINSGVDKKRSGFMAIFISILYAISDEYHQSFTPGREPKVRDVVIDTMGASFAIYYIFKQLAKSPENIKNFAKRFELI